MTNGQSKKVMVVALGINTIIPMAGDPEKLPFAIIIAVLVLGYTIKQTILDWRNSGKGKSKEKDD